MRARGIEHRSVKVIGLEDMIVMGIGLFMGMNTQIISSQLLILPAASFYIRNKKQFYIYGIGYLLSTLFFEIRLFYLGVIILTCILFIYKTGSYLHINQFILIKILALSLGTLVHFYVSFNWQEALLIGAVQYALACSISDKVSWVKKQLVLSDTVYGIFLLGLLIFFKSIGIENIFLTQLVFVLMMIRCNQMGVISLYFLLYLIEPLMLAPLSFIILFILSLIKTQPLLMFMLIAAVLLKLPLNPVLFALYSAVMMLFLLVDKAYFPFGEKLEDNNYFEHNRLAVMNRQLNNFSVIFDHLAHYYNAISEVESDMLKTMAKALSYTAKHCSVNRIDSEYLKEQVIYLLEGYKIDVVFCMLKESDDGCITLELELADFQKREVEPTLLPLLNHVLPTRMEWIKENGNSNLYMFISQPPVQIDAYANSLRHESEACGDAFSIFRYSRNVLCMISDGMGSGESASRISGSLTVIFQRMIASGVDQLEAIRCINKLLQSDSYATMDVLSFDRYKKSATLCKSAACPTYLIRQGELYEINGNSLPIGIVASIEVDSIVVEIEKGDWYLMASDGVYIDEIYRWIHAKKDLSAKLEADTMTDILNQQLRRDDSTFLLAHVL